MVNMACAAQGCQAAASFALDIGGLELHRGIAMEAASTCTCLQDGVKDLAVDGALCNQHSVAEILLVIVICSLLICSCSGCITSCIWLLEQPAGNA